jgi:hypothetical protein
MDKQSSTLDPFSEDSRQLLASLGLDTVPSREQTYREIEERLLLPKETLQEDWLSKYQVWVHCAALIRRLSDLRNQDTGTSRSQYPRYCLSSLLRLLLLSRLSGLGLADM